MTPCIATLAIAEARRRLALSLPPPSPRFVDSHVYGELGRLWHEQIGLALDYLKTLPRGVALDQPLIAQAKGVLLAMQESLGRAFEGRAGL